MVVAALMHDVFGRGVTDLLATIVAEEHVQHSALGDHYGPEGLRIDVETWRSAFPDLTVVLEDLLAVDDRVVRRFVLRGTHYGPVLGIAATGSPVEFKGIAIDRLVERRLVESWVLLDLYGLTRQLASGPGIQRSDDEASHSPAVAAVPGDGAPPRD
jgi:predicted ester cyclase